MGKSLAEAIRERFQMEDDDGQHILGKHFCETNHLYIFVLVMFEIHLKNITWWKHYC